jgi:hypothetical protein
MRGFADLSQLIDFKLFRGGQQQQQSSSSSLSSPKLSSVSSIGRRRGAGRQSTTLTNLHAGHYPAADQSWVFWEPVRSSREPPYHFTPPTELRTSSGVKLSLSLSREIIFISFFFLFSFLKTRSQVGPFCCWQTSVGGEFITTPPPTHRHTKLRFSGDDQWTLVGRLTPSAPSVSQ